MKVEWNTRVYTDTDIMAKLSATIMDPEKVQFGWTMWTAVDQKAH